MNETKHTPGPWRVANHVRTIDGREVECAPDLGMFDACIMTTNNEGRLVAIAGERGSKLNPYDYLTVAESAANMRLIAAAPDLLAVTERSRDMLSLMYSVGVGNEDEAATMRDLITALNAAIAAAKSEATP